MNTYTEGNFGHRFTLWLSFNVSANIQYYTCKENVFKNRQFVK